MTLFLLPFLQWNAHRQTSFSSLWRHAWYVSRTTHLSVSEMLQDYPIRATTLKDTSITELHIYEDHFKMVLSFLIYDQRSISSNFFPAGFSPARAKLVSHLKRSDQIMSTFHGCMQMITSQNNSHWIKHIWCMTTAQQGDPLDSFLAQVNLNKRDSSDQIMHFWAWVQSIFIQWDCVLT